jgi:hypothetical protein
VPDLKKTNIIGLSTLLLLYCTIRRFGARYPGAARFFEVDLPHANAKKRELVQQLAFHTPRAALQKSPALQILS